jgi:nucleoside-diphosphate kinase
MIQQTLAIIKPDAVKSKIVGKIITMIEDFSDSNTEKINISKITKEKLTYNKALDFYSEHKGKFFCNDLCNFMSSEEIYIIVLEGENVISNFRKLIGNTDSSKASIDTIRGKFGSKTCVTENVIHGSDSEQSAKKEILFFFPNHKI